MSKIIYEYMATTPETFVKQEIDEWGFDYVDEMFDKGYEPTLVNGVWYWHVPIQLFRPLYDGSCNSRCDLANSSILHLGGLTAESLLTGIAA